MGWLFWVALALAVADWAALWTGRSRACWLTKPGALAALLAWFLTSAGGDAQLRLFAYALGFSLLGDITLLLPKRYFPAGVLAFALAHGAYILGFNPNLPPMTGGASILLAGVAMLAFRLGRLLDSSLRCDPQLARQRLPMLGYLILLSLMLFSAMATSQRMEWPVNAALMASTGGCFFFLSDMMLAYDRYVRPIHRGRFWVRVTYHIGQGLLAAGALAYAGRLMFW